MSAIVLPLALRLRSRGDADEEGRDDEEDVRTRRIDEAKTVVKRDDVGSRTSVFILKEQ